MDTRTLTLDKLKRLSESQFDEVLFRYNMPPAHLPPGALTQRAIALIHYAEQRQDLANLSAVIDQVLRASGDPNSFQINTHHLPTPTTRELIGRISELAQLNAALADDKIHVIVLQAGGGTGKSTLTWYWLQQLERQDFLGKFARVFGFSFYSQGHHVTYTTSADFFAKVLPFLGIKDIPPDEVDKGRALAACLARQAVFLILDGLEPLQLDDTTHDGRLQNTALQAFFTALRGQAKRRSVVLVSSRQKLVELRQWAAGSFLEINLNQLGDSDGAALLRLQGVAGQDEELQAVAREVGGHALSLALLGALVVLEFDGALPAEWRTAFAHAPSTGNDRHAYRILAWQASRLDNAARRLVFMLGLFDRPLGMTERVLLEKDVAFFAPLRELGMKQRQALEKRLQQAGLLSERRTGSPDSSWDSHALVRAFFARQFAEQETAAFRAAHRALFEFYQTQAPDLPADLPTMQPLYCAVVHGCLAGEFQKAKLLYENRILRGGETSYSTKKLGAYAQDLSVMAAFFPDGWRQPAHTGLSEVDQAWLLAAAAFRLMSLGRLREALEPRTANLELCVKQEDWKNASITAQNLTDLHLPLGQLAQAVDSAAQALVFAERAGDKAEQMKSHAYVARVWHAQGRLPEAAQAFARAEEICGEAFPQYPRLSSIWGAWYCALLLDEAGLDGKPDRSLRPVRFNPAALQAVLERGEYGLKVKTTAPLLDDAFNKLTLARAQALLKTQALAQLKQNFRAALAAIEAAKKSNHYPLFYLARAAFCLEYNELNEAAADLASAWEIIERGDMALYAVDYHLLQARCCALQGDTQTAATHQAQADEGIERTGYGLRRLVGV